MCIHIFCIITASVLAAWLSYVYSTLVFIDRFLLRPLSSRFWRRQWLSLSWARRVSGTKVSGKFSLAANYLHSSLNTLKATPLSVCNLISPSTFLLSFILYRCGKLISVGALFPRRNCRISTTMRRRFTQPCRSLGGVFQALAQVWTTSRCLWIWSILLPITSATVEMKTMRMTKRPSRDGGLRNRAEASAASFKLSRGCRRRLAASEYGRFSSRLLQLRWRRRWWGWRSARVAKATLRSDHTTCGLTRPEPISLVASCL